MAKIKKKEIGMKKVTNSTQHSRRDYDKHNNGVNSKLIIGASVGLVGLGIALFIANSKKERSFQEKIRDTLSDKIESMKVSLPNGSDVLNNIKSISDEAISNPNTRLILGSLGGGLLGAIVIYLINQKNRKSLFDIDLNEVERNADYWIQRAKNFLETIEEGKEEVQEVSKNLKKSNNFDNVLDLVNIGMRVYQNLKK